MRYHHGDLRRALLEAARQLVAERGLNGFTLRQVARLAGVSHAAPYHHFADKAALVAALAEESFAELAGALQAAWGDTAGEPLEGLQAMGLAYVRFAVSHPAEFRFMFRPELRNPTVQTSQIEPAEAQAVERAGLAAYQALVDGIVACQEAGLVAPGDPGPLALTAWSTVHGLAVLLVDGPLQRDAAAAGYRDWVAREVTQRLAQGLLVR